MRSRKNFKTVSSKQYHLTPYGEISFYGEEGITLNKSEFSMIETWSSSLSSGLINVWIENVKVTADTLNTIVHVLINVQRDNPESTVVVQWLLNDQNDNNTNFYSTLTSLFPKVSFMFKKE